MGIMNAWMDGCWHWTEEYRGGFILFILFIFGGGGVKGGKRAIPR
jgi:hypothetical protein